MSSYPFFPSLNFDEIIELENKGEKYLFSLLVEIFKKYNSDTKDLELLEKAYILGTRIHKGQMRESGATYFTHPLMVGLLMSFYKPDRDLLIATLLHDAVEDSREKNIRKEIENIFGKKILHLVEGVSKVTFLQITKEMSSLQTIQKLFSFGSKDSRTLLIKIFDRLHNIITLKGKRSFEKRMKKVEETITIFIPAIERLGLWRVKKSLENACMKELYPNKYIKLRELIERSSLLHNDIISVLESEIDIDMEIEGKHYSSSSLLRHHNSEKSPDEEFFFIRCTVQTEKECYTLSSRLSSIFSHKSKEQRDYISNPKENGYKALQSTYIIGNAHAIRIHIVSKEMKERNDEGIFTDIHKKNYSLPFLNTESFIEMEHESDQFFSYLTGDILVKKIEIHNKEKGQLHLPHTVTVLGAGIYYFPERFQYIKKCFINGKESMFFESIVENDIVEFHFSEKIQCKWEWRNYVKTPFAIEKIIEILSQKTDIEKKKFGFSVMQKIFDESQWGTFSANNSYIEKMMSHFSVSDIDTFCISIAEGRISKRKIERYISNYNHTDLPFWKKCISRFFPHFFSHDSTEKITFSFRSQLHKISETSELLNKYRRKYDIILLSSDYSSNESGIFGSAHIESSNLQSQDDFIADLHSDPRITSVSFFPPFSFILKMILFFIVPIVIFFSIFSVLLGSNGEISSLLLYSAVFFIAFSNAMGYSQIAQYFSFLRHNLIALFLFIISNVLITGGYVWLFIEKGLDIYHLDFYFPLLVIIISLGFPIIFFKKKKSFKKKNMYTNDEFKKLQKKKWIGYMFRLGSILAFSCFIAGIFISFPIMLFQFLNSKKKIKEIYSTEIYPNLNKIFFLIILFDFLFALFYFLSADYIPASHTALYLTLAPILGLIVSYSLYNNHVGIFKNKTLTFSLFFIATIGSVFVFLSKDTFIFSMYGLKGEFFALLLMLLDVYFTFLIIRYFEFENTFKPLQFTLFLMFILGVSLSPFSIYYLITHWEFLTIDIFFSLFLMGVFIFLLRYFILESYSRCNGLINYLLMNLFPLGVILFEFYYFNLSLSILFISGTFLILFSSFLIEVINTYIEKKEQINKRNT